MPASGRVPAGGSVADTLRASLLLGASSAVSVALALVLNKVAARLVGPIGVGYYALLQNLVALLVLVAGLGLGTVVVRVGAPAAAAGDAARVTAVSAAAWRITIVAGVCAAFTVAVARRPLAAALLGDERRAPAAVAMGAVAIVALLAATQLGLLNMTRSLRALAIAGPATSAAGTAGAVAAFAAGAGVPVAAALYVALGGLATTLVYVRARARQLETGVRPPPAAVRDATRDLLRAGLPYTASLLTGQGVQLLMPSLVLRLLDPATVGLQRAAATVSSAYLGLLLAAMARVYYPQVAAAGNDGRQLAELVNRQQTLVMLVGAPTILTCLAVARQVIPLVYAPAFAPAAEILEWQLVGELLRFSSWTMAFVVLARGSGWLYFSLESGAGVALVVATAVCARLFGRAGLGIGYAVGYGVYLVACYAATRASVGPVWRLSHLGPLALCVVAALGVVLLSGTRFGGARLWAGVVVAAVAWAVSALRLRPLLRSTPGAAGRA